MARRVQRSTVEGSLADAIAAGYAYDWHRLGVPPAAVQSIRQVLEAAPCRGTRIECTIEGQDGSDCEACHRQQHDARVAAGVPLGGSELAGLSAGVDSSLEQQFMQDAVMPDSDIEATTSMTAGRGGMSPIQELTEQWVQRLGGIKQLKGSLTDDISFGHIRLALAHLAREQRDMAGPTAGEKRQQSVQTR